MPKQGVQGDASPWRDATDANGEIVDSEMKKQTSLYPTEGKWTFDSLSSSR